MLIAIVIVLICLSLMIGMAVPFAFAVSMLYISLNAGIDMTGLLPSGHMRMNTLVLLAIPLFIMAGAIMEKGKIAAPLVDLAEIFVGRVRGGLSASTVVASGVFGSISGSASATLTCIGSIMLPRLHAAKYPRGYSSALIANAAPLGLLIPPSAIQIIYAWVTRQSVLKCFLATIIPALIFITLLIIVNFVMLRRHTEIKSPEPPANWPKAVANTSSRAFPALLMPIIILGGIYGGVMTPTEAAGIAVIYAIPVGFWVYRGLNRKNFTDAIVEAATTTGVVMVMFFMVMIVSRLLVLENIPAGLQELISMVSENPIVTLVMVNIAMVMIGMLMDDVSGVLISAPLFFPIVTEVGMDPIQFAAVLGVNLGMGNITPPTAPLLFLGARVGQTPINEMMRPTVIMILFAWVPTLLLTTFVPQIALWLPTTLVGN